MKSAIVGARSLNIKGLNVTIPHKIDVVRYLEEIDEIASLIGAVNTIDFEEMKGYNTDGIGANKTAFARLMNCYGGYLRHYCEIGRAHV